MRKILATIATTALALTAFVLVAPQLSAKSTHAQPPRSRALHNDMRQLWEEHVMWTRLFIVSDVANLPDLSATTDRLLRNQDDIGNAIKPFFGTDAGDQLTALLRQHILEAADILHAAKANDAGAVASAETAWYANANQIAAFLHNLNPHQWSLAMLQDMMKEHLDLTLAEAVDQLQGNYAQSVHDYDRVELEILGMADMLSSGLAPGQAS